MDILPRYSLSFESIIGNDEGDSNDSSKLLKDFQILPKEQLPSISHERSASTTKKNVLSSSITLQNPLPCPYPTIVSSLSTIGQNEWKMEDNALLNLKLKGDEKELLKKSAITPDYEQRQEVPNYHEAKRKRKLESKKERMKTKGSKWYNLPATEMTDEIRNDLTVLRMRSALDPKRFYKSNDIDALPKYFQIGTVIESSADFYHSRVPMKQRKRTIVEELMDDAKFKQYTKRKFREIVKQQPQKSKGKKNERRFNNKRNADRRRSGKVTKKKT